MSSCPVGRLKFIHQLWLEKNDHCECHNIVYSKWQSHIRQQENYEGMREDYERQVVLCRAENKSSGGCGAQWTILWWRWGFSSLREVKSRLDSNPSPNAILKARHARTSHVHRREEEYTNTLINTRHYVLNWKPGRGGVLARNEKWKGGLGPQFKSFLLLMEP